MPETAPDTIAPETRDENALDLGYTVSVEAFSGPLDLLLFLVRKTELDIVDIPVAAIADQFVSLVSEWQREGTLDLEAAGDFILMAATLLEIKARTIAPPPLEEGERPAEDDDDDILDPRTDLIGKLLAYRKFKEAVGLLVEREAERALHVTRQLREDIPEDPDEAAGIDLGELQVAELSKYWYTLLARIGGGGPRTVMKDDLPIEGSIRKLAERAEQERELSLYQLFAAEPALQGRISMLMATLECTRQRIVQATQHEQYADAQLRFRPVEERAIVPVVFPPDEGGKKRRRRPPLVTFQAPVAPSSDELEDALEPEEKHETDEERFLRELNEACDLDGVLGRVHDVEKGFQQYWETLHPPEPKPVVESPVALVAEPVAVPEARVESPVPPVAEAPVIVAEQPVAAVSEAVAVEPATIPVAEQAIAAPPAAEAVREEASAPVDASVAVATGAVAAETVRQPVDEPVAAAVPEPVAAEPAPIAHAEPQAPVVEQGAEPVAEKVLAAEPAVEPPAAITELGAPPAEVPTAASVDEVPVAASEPEAIPVEPAPSAYTEPVIAQEPAVEPAAIVAQDVPPIAQATALETDLEPVAPVAPVAVETTDEVPVAEVPPVEDAPPEPPAALVRDFVPEVRVEIAPEEVEPVAESRIAEDVPPEKIAGPLASVVPPAIEPEPMAETVSPVEEPHTAESGAEPVVEPPAPTVVLALAVEDPPAVDAPVADAAEVDVVQASAPASAPVLVAEVAPSPVAAEPAVAEPQDAPAAAVPPFEPAIPVLAAGPALATRSAPAPERRSRWSRTLLLLVAGSAGAALAGWWVLRAPPEALPIASVAPMPAAPAQVEPAPLAVAPEPQAPLSIPLVAPASAAQLDGMRIAPSAELLALIEGPADHWMGRTGLPIAVPWYACAPVAETPTSLFAFVQPPVLTGLPLLAFAREGAWAWCAAGAWVPPRMQVLPASAFVPEAEPPMDLVAWATPADFSAIPAEVFLQPTGWAVCAGRPAAAIALLPPVRLAESPPVAAPAEAPAPAAEAP